MDMMNELVNYHELKYTNINDTKNQVWNLSEMKQTLIDRQLQHIVGFEIEINKFEGKFKLSQNKDKQTQQKVINGLKETGNIGLANEMKHHLNIED
jgi:predicted FMN-binding regulatory protein PaiB